MSATNSISLLKYAKEYRDIGLSIVAVNLKKKPMHTAWLKYQTELMDNKVMIHKFSKDKQNAPKIGIVTGHVSGDLEVIDIDDANIFEQFYGDIVWHFGGNGQMVCTVKTRKGYHIYFRNDFDMSDPPEDVECGNLKLARHKKDSDNNCLIRIETRGQGGYIVAPPSEDYEFIYGSSFDFIPKWTLSDREHIFEIAKDYDLLQKIERPKIERSNTDYKGTPWYEYDMDPTNSFEDELVRYGWTIVGEDSTRIYYLRPGDSTAKHSANFHKELRLFKCFSTSTVFEDQKAYRPSVVRCILNYGDDTIESLSKNAKDLLNEGFGSVWSNEEKTVIQKGASEYVNNPSTTKEAVLAMIKDGVQQFKLDETQLDTLHQIAKDTAKKETKDIKAQELLDKKTKAIIDHIASTGMKRNEVTDSLEAINDQGRLTELDDYDINSHYLDIKKEVKNITKGLVLDHFYSNRVTTYHPFRDFFDKLPEHKGDSQIDSLFDTLTLKAAPKDLELCRSLFKKWILQFVCASYGIGPSDLMLILVGKQNSGKTWFLENILPKPLRTKYSTKTQNFPKKEEDAKMLLAHNLHVFLDEFEITNHRSDTSSWRKEILSSSTLKFRPPYGRVIKEYQRYGVLSGASNHKNVLNDQTGNRRYIPLELMYRDRATYDEIINDPDFKLWSEIKSLFDAASTYEAKRELTRLTDAEHLYLNSLGDFEQVDILSDSILKYFGKPNLNNGFYEYWNHRDDSGIHAELIDDARKPPFMTAGSVYEHLRKVGAIESYVCGQQIGTRLTKLGFEKIQRRLKGSTSATRGYAIYRLPLQSSIYRQWIKDEQRQTDYNDSEEAGGLAPKEDTSVLGF